MLQRLFTKCSFSPSSLLFMLIMLVILSGCGAGGAGTKPAVETVPAAPTTASAAPAPANEAAKSAVRIYQDAKSREVEIPAHPTRIAAHYFASEMVALQAPVVATNHLNAKLSLTPEQLSKIEDIGGDGVNPNVEKLLSVNPDLIILPDFLEQKTIDAVAKIAPTVVMNYSEDAFTRLKKLGDVAGVPAAADQWLSAYDAKIKKKKEELEPLLKNGATATAFVLHSDKKLYVYGAQRLGPTMYNALGFKQPDKVKELFANDPQALWKEISLEVLPQYAGDYIFIVTAAKDGKAVTEMDELLSSPIWKSLPAVKNGKAHVVGTRWGLNDPLTLEWLLDEMSKALKQ
ncbi:iron complex transport system substrate-binding protein [Paenibacillus sp. UNCCL117]|uniref:ABC transporter substrate-binding protein n=1 Tax=unclassified Paenibacillus TaxID=185978 RepID=UPI000884796B|nr:MULTISPECIES: ABC transporter substrate-binding protein [unclassified Paenibacillus]SDC27649.1 iron complex transport system substrate-binding protein [Paenibacillus sp. cl123]SFW20379.1 iron complex transport system substrate-binding protein [Paenibacillus sp. UNCCL117]